jgi:HEAT repeat protein
MRASLPRPRPDDVAPSQAQRRLVAIRRGQAALAGLRGDEDTARALLGDPEPTVRAAAFAALCRLGAAREDDAASALADASPWVRRSALEQGAALPGRGALGLLDDPDASVVEAACYALGELGLADATDRLARIARDHSDPLCREAAVAAIGAIGDRTGLGALLDALEDAPAIRRRAVVALAAFEGPEVDAALRARLGDRDWQVRQAAEDVLGA